VTSSDLVTTFVRWTWMRAALHNGWWLVTSVYLVVDAGLTPSELVFIGAAQGVVAFVCEVPAGVLADTISRRWALVISHGVMGTAMLLTGLVTAFPALVATQMLWGLSWTFASGSDIAWITDELAQPARIPAVLARAARWQLTGAGTGLIGFGALAWATRRDTAMVVAGAAMLALGIHVTLRFREDRFVPTRTRRWAASWSIFTRGLSRVRGSPVLLVIFAATFLINGASDAAGRLYPKQLLEHGFPTEPDPIVWFTALGVAGLAAGAAALRIAQHRIEAVAARRDYALAATIGMLGLLALAIPDTSPLGNAALGSAAVLLVVGIAIPLTRTITTIWVNHETTSDVRATVHSFLAQSEYLGEITCGLLLALLANVTTLGLALVGCAVLFAVTAGLMLSPGIRVAAFRASR
jgi:MFS transporter, DHA3 family, tetracycline resistance protein